MTLNLSVPTDEKNDAWNLGTGHLFPTCFLPQSTVFRLSLSSQHYYNRAGCWRRFKRWKSMKEANTMREQIIKETKSVRIQTTEILEREINCLLQTTWKRIIKQKTV